MFRLHLTFHLVLFVFGISIASANEFPKCLEYVGFSPSVIQKLKDKIKCGDLKTGKYSL